MGAAGVLPEGVPRSWGMSSVAEMCEGVWWEHMMCGEHPPPGHGSVGQDSDRVEQGYSNFLRQSGFCSFKKWRTAQ